MQDLWINVFENPEIELDENQLNLFKLMHKQQEIFRKLYEEMNFFGTITHQNFNSFLYFKIYEQYFLTILINNIVEKTPKGHTIYSSGPKDSDGWEKLQVIVNDPSTFTYSIIDGFLIDGKEEVYDKHIPSYLDNIKLNIIKKKTI